MTGAGSEDNEPPRLSARQVHTAAIVQNIIRYYTPRPKSPPPQTKQRERQPSADATESPTITATKDSAYPSAAVPEAPSIPLPSDVTPLSHDPTLTAFAQLAAFRLECDRGMISLIDHKHQYVIAEATRSVSLHNPENCLPGDELFVGPLKLPTAFGICPDTMHVFTAVDDKLNVATDNVTANQHCYVVNDLAEVDCFKEKPYVSGWPFVRFYAEVPLKSNGFVIGSVCVVDGKPRSGMDVAALDRLAEVASAVASHLDLVQTQTRLRRSQAMVRGLGRFVDGKSVSEWWKDTFNDQFKNLSSTSKEGKSAPSQGFAQTLSTGSDLQYTASPRALSPANISTSDLDEAEHSPAEHFDSLAVTATHSSRSQTGDPPQPVAIRLQELGPQLEVPKKSPLPTVPSNSATLSIRTPSPEDPNQREQISYKALQRLFSRASHLIKESSELDGIIFVDASLQDISITQDRRRSVMTPANTPRFGSVPETPAGSNSGFPVRIKLDPPPTITPQDELPAYIRQGFKAQVEIPAKGKIPVCQLLGYSLHPSSGRNDAAPSSSQIEVPQSTLRSLLRRYPYGTVFLFNADGSLLDDDEMSSLKHSPSTGRPRSHTHTKDKSHFEKAKDQLRAYQLLHICPGARGIIFFPLWDPQRDQWFAGSLAWTRDAARILSLEDVTFFAAFGSCIMAEKSKMDALTADRAKTDFISSVSHELRSPLHGILATVEVLADTAMNTEQDDLIRTVSTCGEVLMDTMDHILDYAKLSKSKKMRSLATGGAEELDLRSSRNIRVTTFDLSNLVECVVEGIFAGHNYRSLVDPDKLNSEHAWRKQHQSSIRLTPPSMNPNVMVIVDIERQPTWLFESQIGAWKRILTNLFGNALKYTEAGFVRVCLSAVPMPSRPNSFVVTLEIQDSGIGMTNEYIKHRLYTPFAQANPLSAGTGLGLSIVRQLVNDLEGSIDFESELGYGTWVKVSVPTTISSSDQPDEQSIGSTAKIRDIKVWCVDLTICLVGFDYYPEIEEAPTGILSAHERRMLAIRSSMKTLLAEWFGMKVEISPSLEEAKGDILMAVQSQINLTPKQNRKEPLIFFEDCYSGFRADNETGIFHLSQPVGPHKLARVLGLCLEHRFAVGITPDSPHSPPRAASSYGFPIEPQSQETQQDTSPTARSALHPRSTSQLEVPTVDISNLTPTPGPAPVLVKPRSVVLLVEDNSVNMKILMNHMKRAKEEYATATNGLEALHKYQEEHQSIKVIFMDISMPVKDGITATKEIRQFERESSLPRVRIAALTCFSSDEYQTNAFAAGVDLFLVKPIPMKALKPVLEMDPDVVVPPS